MRNPVLAAAVVLSLGLASSASAARVTAEIIADHTAVPAGGTVTLALHYTIEPGWHLYWINPGETGVPPKVKWTLPAGVTAGPLRFPTPRRILGGELTTFGYEKELTLLVDLTVPADATGPLAIRGDLRWVVCREECVAERQMVSIDLPVGVGQTHKAARFAAWRAEQPDRSITTPIAAVIGSDAKIGTLDVPLAEGETAVDFFPPPAAFAVYGPPQEISGDKSDSSRIYRLPFRVLPDAPADYSATGLVVTRAKDGRTVAREVPFKFNFPSH